MQDVHAPYNFVPLARQVWFPEQPELVTQDIPFKDGLCGTLELRITAETPLLLGTGDDGAARRSTVTPYLTPDGRYAIAGSSLHGLIRNTIEIAAFGKMQRVDDKRLAVRDLTGGVPGYQKSMAGPGPSGSFAALAKGGWLEFRDGHWRITPCEYSRVDHPDLRTYLSSIGGRPQQFFSRFGERPNAERKYALYLQAGGRMDVPFTPDAARTWEHSEDKRTKQKKKLFYSKALNLGTGPVTGRIVLTGQPNQGNKPGQKHMEFIFHGEQPSQTQEVDAVMRVFLEVYRETPEWMYWDRMRRGGERIPVFWLKEDNSDRVRYIGLSQMFKLPYTHSFHDAIRHSSEDHLAPCPDLAELLFGFMEQDGGKEDGGLRGRVSFSLAQLEGEPRLEPLQQTVLNGPKASYFPAYLRQKHIDRTGNLPSRVDNNGRIRLEKPYTTLMDSDVQLRGWKRYPVREQSRIPPHTELQRPDDNGRYNTDVTVSLQPLAAGSQFQGRVRIHNLRPFELGALFWALDFGGNGRHALGMGKPFGLGRVHLEVVEESLIANDLDAVAPDRQSCLKAFQEKISKAIPNWSQTPQVRALCAMASPAESRGKSFDYLFLGEKEENQFVQAKKDGAVLPEYVAIGNLGQKTPLKCVAKASEQVEANAVAAKPAAPPPEINRESWGPLRLEWDKSRVTFKDITFNGRRATVSTKQAAELLTGLSNEDVTRLKNKGELKGASVEIERSEGSSYSVVKSISRKQPT